MDEMEGVICRTITIKTRNIKAEEFKGLDSYFKV